jgi:putative membrane protein
MRRFTLVTYWNETEPEWDRGDVPWIVRILVRWGMVMLGFLAAEWLVNELYDRDRFFIDGWEALFAAAAIFVAVRAILRPILIFLTCPLQLITLGLFIFVVNALILLFTEEVCDWFSVNFAVDGFWPAFLGALVISLTGFVLSRFLRRNPMKPVRL